MHQMKTMMIAMYVVFFVVCYGFLLDTQTQFPPTRASLMTDNHFNLLIGLLNDARQSRIELENYVKQLEQDFALAKQEISLYVLSNINATLNGFINDTAILKHRFNSLKSEISQQFNKQSVDLQKSNEVVYGEMRIHSDRIDGNFSLNRDILSGIERDIHNATLKEDILKRQQNATTATLSQKVSNLQNQLYQLSSRVAMTLCLVNETDFVNGQVIKFNAVISEIGINNTDTLKSKGTFTCEKTGLYLVSAFIQTSKHSSGFQIMKNNERIATGFASFNSGYQTITAVAIEHLSVNDTVSVIAYKSPLTVEGDRESCLSILQVL